MQTQPKTITYSSVKELFSPMTDERLRERTRFFIESIRSNPYAIPDGWLEEVKKLDGAWKQWKREAMLLFWLREINWIEEGEQQEQLIAALGVMCKMDAVRAELEAEGQEVAQ